MYRKSQKMRLSGNGRICKLNYVVLKVYLLLLLLFLSSYLFANSIKKDITSYNWITNPTDSYCYMKVDSTTTPYSLLWETTRHQKGASSVDIPLFRTNKDESKVGLKIRYKTENCKELYLSLGAIGGCEQVTVMDTLSLPLNKEWTTVSYQSINVKKQDLLNLSVEAKGDSLKNAKVWISNLDIFIDGKNLNELENIDHNIKTPLTKEDVIPLNNKDKLPFWNKKILAIGETIHGTEEMNNIAVEIIKDRITNNNCKYVLIETPIEYSFYINRYVNGDQRFKLDSISTYFNNYLYSKSLVSLAQWIKEYNSQSIEKVSFIGIDWNISQIRSQVNLFNFFYTINNGSNDPELKKMCSSLLMWERNFTFKKSLSIFNTNHDFENVLSKKESELMRYCLTIEDKASRDYARFIKRDTIMYKNTEFIIENLLKHDETATLFCHLLHVNYLSKQEEAMNLNQLPMGYFIKNKYQDDYSCIGLVAEKGNFLTNKSKAYCEIAQLQPSPYNSIEHLINKRNVDSCYLSMDKLVCSDVLGVRIIGSSNRRNQFTYILPKSRIEGVIFIKQVSAVHKDKRFSVNEPHNDGALIMFSLMRALEQEKAMRKDDKCLPTNSVHPQ